MPETQTSRLPHTAGRFTGGVSIPMLALCVVAAMAVGALLAGRGQMAAAQQFTLPTPEPVSPASSDVDGIFAVTGPLTDKAYGLYIVDTRRRSVAVYEYVAGDRGGKVLQLRAVRNFGYDTRLMEYNTSPAPAEIAELVGQDRSRPQ